MRVCGIIAEYNPFHVGHAAHLAAARARSGADYVVAALSGNFTQRGEAALCDKWARTEMALAAGVDAVFELPALFAVRPAEAFGWGGACLLAGLGVVTHLSFGVETEDFALLERLADLWADETSAFQAAMREGLSAGWSHAAARTEAAARALAGVADPADVRRALESPNSLLAVSYLLALRRMGSGIVPVPVRRETAHVGAERAIRGGGGGMDGRLARLELGAAARGFADPESVVSDHGFADPEAAVSDYEFADPEAAVSDHGFADPEAAVSARGFANTESSPLPRAFPSASAIRAALRAGRTDAYDGVPEAVRPLLRAALLRNPPQADARLMPLLHAALRLSTPERIAQMPEVAEGLENRLHRAAAASDLLQALAAAKTRRVPYTRLQRTCVHLLLGMDSAHVRANPAPAYARLLGFRQSARPLLHEIARRAALPVVTKAADFPGRETAAFRLDVRATDAYSLLQAHPEDRRAGRDFTTSPVVL